VWTFGYDLNTPGSPYLDQLKANALVLVSDLNDFCPDEDPRRPLMFISHSLGGLLLKEAICILQGPPRSHQTRHIVNIISGLCFISVPQLPDSYQPTNDVLYSMISANKKEPPPRSALTNNGNERIRELSSNFRNVLEGHERPLTLCEAGETKVVVRGLIAKIKKKGVRIVPKEISAIGVANEKGPVEVSKPHDVSCQFKPTDEAYLVISEWVQNILKDAPAMIANLFNHDTPPGLRGTIRSHSRADSTSIADPKDLLERLEGVEKSENESESGQPISTDRQATAGSTKLSYEEVAAKHAAAATVEPSNGDPRLPIFEVPPLATNELFGRGDVYTFLDLVLIPQEAPVDQVLSLSISEQGEKNSSGATALQLRSFSLCGMGGIGKTSTAIQYAHTRKDKFEAVFWIKADEKDVIISEFARMARALHLFDSSDSKDLQLAVQAFLGWLSRPVRSYSVPYSDKIREDVSWLLIFDNVNDLDVLAEFWPGEGTGSIIITSRNQMAKRDIQGHKVTDGIDLKPLSDAESAEMVQLLTKALPQDGQEEALKEVVILLGGLPLLITSMTGAMHRLGLSYVDFVELYNESGLEKASNESRSTTSGKAMYDIFAKFGLSNLTKQTIEMLQILSFMDPDGIPESLLFAGLKGNLEGVLYPADREQYFSCRKELLQSSLIYHNVAGRYVHLHRVVQDITRQKLGKQGEIKYLNAAVSLVSKVWPFVDLEHRFATTRWTKCEEYFPHVTRLRNTYQKLQDELDDPQLYSIQAGRLFNDAGW
jgi:NB-ARC domain